MSSVRKWLAVGGAIPAVAAAVVALGAMGLGIAGSAAATPPDPFLGTWWAIEPVDGSLEHVTFGAGGSLFFGDDSSFLCGGGPLVAKDVGTVSGNTWTGSGTAIGRCPATGQTVGPVFLQFTLNPDGMLSWNLNSQVWTRTRPAAASNKCPSGDIPAPGSTVNGGLEVDGRCILTDVTIKGGVTVDPVPFDESRFPELELRRGHVTGGIVVYGGNLSLGFNGDTGELTHGPVTIDGGITLNRPFSYVLAGATINSGITMNGGYDFSPICDGEPFCFTGNSICGNEIYGDVTIRDDNTEQIFVGDPGEQFFANGDCAGNTIHGSVFLTDTNFARKSDGEPSEIEGDTVSGSIHVDHSTAEVYGNTVGDSLLCTNGSIIHPAPPGDPSGTTNTVNGANTCFP